MDFQKCLQKHSKNIKELQECIKKTNSGGGMQNFLEDIQDDKELLNEFQDLMIELSHDTDFQEN